MNINDHKNVMTSCMPFFPEPENTFKTTIKMVINAIKCVVGMVGSSYMMYCEIGS